MYEGAVAYYRATGKRKWLDVAEKNAKHINKVFFEGDANYNGGVPVNQPPGHQEIELALVKLYQVTGNELYLDMAQKFIDVRGVSYRPEGEGVMAPSYAQQHLPVREQRTAEGHSVRAMYLYSGMADVVASRGDTTLVPALESIWHDIIRNGNTVFRKDIQNILPRFKYRSPEIIVVCVIAHAHCNSAFGVSAYFYGYRIIFTSVGVAFNHLQKELSYKGHIAFVGYVYGNIRPAVSQRRVVYHRIVG